MDGDLFDFDSEVQPILETLVGRTLQQALTEVMHEEEIADLREQQQKMMAIREAELAELRRMEEQEKRLQGEKVRLELNLKIDFKYNQLFSRTVVLLKMKLYKIWNVKC